MCSLPIAVGLRLRRSGFRVEVRPEFVSGEFSVGVVLQQQRQSSAGFAKAGGDLGQVDIVGSRPECQSPGCIAAFRFDIGLHIHDGIMVAPESESSKMLLKKSIAKSYIIIYLLNSSQLLARHPGFVILAQITINMLGDDPRFLEASLGGRSA